MLLALLLYASLYASFTPISVRMLSYTWFVHYSSLFFPPPLYLLTNLLCFHLFAFPFGIFSPLLPVAAIYLLLSSLLPCPPPFFQQICSFDLYLLYPPHLPTGSLVVESSIKHHSKLLATPFLHLYGTIPE